MIVMEEDADGIFHLAKATRLGLQAKANSPDVIVAHAAIQTSESRSGMISDYSIMNILECKRW